MSRSEPNTRLDNPLSRRNCQMFSTGFNSGARAGSSTSVRLSGTTRSHDEVLGAVPSGPVHQQDPMGSGSHGLRDFRQVQAHRLRVASRQHQGCPLALLRADRSEDVDRACPLIMRGPGPGAPSGPAPGDLVLLAHPGLVLPPQFYGSALREALWECPSGGPPGSLPRWPGGFFKSLQRLRVLGIVTGAGRELAIAKRAQFAAQGRLAERDLERLP